MSFPRYFFAVLVVLLAISAFEPLVATSATPSPAPLGTLPPLQTIEHLVAHPLCYALKENIGPAIGMVLQNDAAIAKAPNLLDDFNKALGNGDGGKGRRNIALLRMENIVGPLTGNILAIQKKLDDPEVFPKHPRNEEERMMLKMRDDLRKTLAAQSFQLDVINGFVQTQQLHQMQYEGFGFINAINQPDVKSNPFATPTPGPFSQDQQLKAGLEQQQFVIDPSTIPGLSLGYNPITRLVGAMQYVAKQSQGDEQRAAQSVVQSVRRCDAFSGPKKPQVIFTPHP